MNVNPNKKEPVSKMNNYSGYSPFPNKNFVFLQKYTTLNELGEPCTDLNMGCPDIDEHISSASGAVVKKFKDIAFILTAGHFCSNESEESIIPKYDDKEVVRAFSVILQDFQFPASIVKIDRLNDLCLVKVVDPDIKKMRIERLSVARKMPYVGEEIYTVSAPLGVFSPWTRHHFKGYFSGCDDYFDIKLTFCFYTIPATEGSSGSLVLNSSGEIVGMIQMALGGFENISLGIENYKIDSFLKEAGSEINIIF